MILKNKKYTDEFKLNTVKMIVDQKLNAKQISQDMDIAYGTLKAWIGHYKREGSHHFKEDNTRDELRTLQRRYQIVKQERDILKKALGIFSSTKETSTNS